MDEERQLAGRMAGVMFVTGGVTAVLLLLLPGVEDAHWKWVVAIGSACVAFGVVCLVARDMSATVLCHHVPAAGSLAAAAGVTAATGGAGSPARFYVIFVLVYVAHYFSRDEALLYLPACLAVALSPLAYDDSAADGGYLGELLVICPAYVIVAGLIMDGKRLLVDARERARSLSLIDPLTELPNRRAMLEWLDAHMEDERGVGLMLVDLDGFKDVNTVHGHPAGDAVLREAAQRLRGCVGGDDFAARLGGDEFALLAPAADPARMERLSARVLEAVRTMDQPGPYEVRLTASVGWALHRDTGTVDELIASADTCMRGAKLTGKDRVLSVLDWSAST